MPDLHINFHKQAEFHMHELENADAPKPQSSADVISWLERIIKQVITKHQ